MLLSLLIGLAASIFGGKKMDSVLGEKFDIKLVLLLALAALLRFHGIAAHCFWVDEVASVQLASGHPVGKFDFPTDQLLPNGFYTSDPFGGSPRAVRWAAIQASTSSAEASSSPRPLPTRKAAASSKSLA